MPGIHFIWSPRDKKTITASGVRGTKNSLRTAVSFRGQLETNYLEIEWLVPETGLEF